MLSLYHFTMLKCLIDIIIVTKVLQNVTKILQVVTFFLFLLSQKNVTF